VSIKTKDKSKKIKVNHVNSPLEGGKGDVIKTVNQTKGDVIKKEKLTAEFKNGNVKFRLYQLTSNNYYYE
jgi:hypothetical protein